MKWKAAAPRQEPPAITRTETLTLTIEPLVLILMAMVMVGKANTSPR